ncbi:MAG: hypothetical protein KAG66_06305 [Methylococcales bacterium]|nr:hypothetical protein [Methylococcales bacterium]
MPYIMIEESEIHQIVEDTATATAKKVLDQMQNHQWMSAKSVGRTLDLKPTTVHNRYKILGLPEPKKLGKGQRPRRRWLRDDVLALVK